MNAPSNLPCYILLTFKEVEGKLFLSHLALATRTCLVGHLSQISASMTVIVFSVSVFYTHDVSFYFIDPVTGLHW